MYYYEIPLKKLADKKAQEAFARAYLTAGMDSTHYMDLIQHLGLSSGIFVAEPIGTYKRAYKSWPEIVIQERDQDPTRMVISSPTQTTLPVEQQEKLGMTPMHETDGDTFMRANNAEGWGPLFPTLWHAGNGVAMPEGSSDDIKIAMDPDMRWIVPNTLETITLATTFTNAVKEHKHATDAYIDAIKKGIIAANNGCDHVGSSYYPAAKELSGFEFTPTFSEHQTKPGQMIVLPGTLVVPLRDGVFRITPDPREPAGLELQHLYDAIPEKHPFADGNTFAYCIAGQTILRTMDGNVKANFNDAATLSNAAARWLEEDAQDRACNRIPPPMHPKVTQELQRLFPKQNPAGLELKPF